MLSDPALWKLIRDNSASAGLAPLVALAARSHVSPEERLWCDKVLTQSWARYQQSLHQLNYALDLLDAAGIRAIALKGPLLALRYYDPPFLRKPSTDIDLAIGEADLERACEAFEREGYTPAAPLRWAKAISYHAVFLHPTKRRIELHFRLTPKALEVPIEEFFARAVPFTLQGGRNVLLLSPVDELLFLVLHLTSDRFAMLFHTCEVRRIWAANPPEIRREAVQRGLEYHCVSALKIADIACRSLWGEALLPPGARLTNTWLDWRLNENLYKAFAAWWRPDNTLSLGNRLRGRWLDFQLTDHPSDALSMARRLALTAWFQLGQRGWRNPKSPRFKTTGKREG